LPPLLFTYALLLLLLLLAATPLFVLVLARSVGVVMFVMLFGYPPFHAESDADIFRLILAGFDPVTKKGYKGTCNLTRI
jgi:hypothetical protein